MPRLFKIIGLGLVAGLLVAGIAILLIYRATQHVPEFYTAAMPVQAEAGDEFEKRVLDLRNDLVNSESWEVTLTDEQINSWLATHLPRKFPQALPKAISEPRISIRPQVAHFACQYEGRIATVISLEAAVQVTENPNELAVTIHSVRAGTFPLPAMEAWKEQLEQAALQSGLALRWVQVDGKLSALIGVPLGKDKSGRATRLQAIELLEEKVVISGRSEADAATSTTSD